MSASGYRVDHAKLDGAGKQVKEQARAIDKIKDDVRAAEVPTDAWGLLGVSLGLFPAYLTMLSDLESHLGMADDHITEVGEVLSQSARAYKDMEDGLTSVLAGLQSDTEDWAARHPRAAEKVVTEAGTETAV